MKRQYRTKIVRQMRAGRYETGSDGKFASRWRAKSPDALCAVLPKILQRKKRRGTMPAPSLCYKGNTASRLRAVLP